MKTELTEYVDIGDFINLPKFLSEREREVLVQLTENLFQSEHSAEKENARENLLAFTGTGAVFQINSMHMADGSYFAVISTSPKFNKKYVAYVGEEDTNRLGTRYRTEIIR